MDYFSEPSMSCAHLWSDPPHSDPRPEAKRRRLNREQEVCPNELHHDYTAQQLRLVEDHNWGFNSSLLQAFDTSQPKDLCIEYFNVTNSLAGSVNPEPLMLDHEASLAQQTAAEGDTLVCYGMISSIEAKCDAAMLNSTTNSVVLETSQTFRSSDAAAKGIISSQHGQMLQGLLDEMTLQLFAVCTVAIRPLPKRTSYDAQVACTLEITVFGPWQLFESIGLWLQEYDVYLQDPRSCQLDAKYCNPHKLGTEDLENCPLLSEVTSRIDRLAHIQIIDARPDLLDVLGDQDDLPEANTPSIIETHLHRHQRQALSFMQRREKGWDFETNSPDLWEKSETFNGRYFINRVSQVHQEEPPHEFRGGIIADPMGLGKTLTMIALAASDLDLNQDQDLHPDSWSVHHKTPTVRATLIVVPQPLLGSWEKQLSDHVRKDGLHFGRHHGKSRLSNISDINTKHVILTTYHTLSADWQASKNRGDHVIFSVRWKRIVLDEAHIVRNLKARMARAICDLEAESRWAVTGTPIQNSLNDLAALLKFIQAFPYHEPKNFEKDISRLWKSGEDKEAVRRLRRVAKCLILRRPKHTIDLPLRHDHIYAVEFSQAERILYDHIRQQTIQNIDDALQHESEISTSGVYVNVLQQLESMRLFCDLGLHYQSRHEKTSAQGLKPDWPAVAQETFNTQRVMEPIVCFLCTSALDITGVYTDDIAIEAPLFSRCLKYACPNCASRLRSAKQKMVCGHAPRCPVAPVSIFDTALEETSGYLAQPAEDSTSELPSKVVALIQDLKQQPTDVKSIVFSTWRLTLDVIEAGLAQHNISCVRFDGKVPQTQRQAVLNQFSSNSNVKVMLLTLSCGAVGLTLTEATRAYLMEPHWNPTIEEQALARIHRIGQTREVTTVRFYIQGSFEERVMEVQNSKKNLAGLLLSGHDGGQADDSLGALQRLRALL